MGICIRDNPPRVRGADVVYIPYTKFPRQKPPKGFVRLAPVLVIEVLRNADVWKNLEQKVSEYHSIGVDMVWVADPHTRTVKTFPRGGEPVVIHDGSTIDGGSILPGFSVPIAHFFDM